MAETQTSAEIDNTATALRANDPPRDTRPPTDVNASLGIVDKSRTSAPPDTGTPDKYDSVQHSLADMYRQHIASDGKTESGLIGTMQKGLKDQEARVEHMGIEAEKLKPWDEEQKSKEFHTDPVRAFGSLGSVFGILASAFTRTPMVNALNASAAAMDAIKAGDEQAYNRAFKASDANYKMAIERHRIEMDAYNAHDGLLKTNIGLWREKQRVEAARFGDTKKLLMLDNGMDSEFMKIREADSKVATEMSKNRTDKLQADMEMARYMALVKENGGDMRDPTNPGNQKAYQQLQKEKADLKRSEHYGAGTLSLGREDAQEVATRTAKYESEGLSHEDAFNKARTEVAAAAKKGSAREAKPEEQFVKERAKELQEQNGLGQAEALAAAQHEWKIKTAAPTGNKMDDIKSRENKITLAETTMDKLDGMLVKHKAITGIGGKITRTGEAVGNILGSSATDRAQFRRWVLELQEILPSVINDRNGRPISSEAAKIEGIVAGLAAGDTNANTSRAYNELRPLLNTLKKQLRERRGVEGETSAMPASPKTRSWEAYPEVK